jgi:hypothetical protein
MKSLECPSLDTRLQGVGFRVRLSNLQIAVETAREFRKYYSSRG